MDSPLRKPDDDDDDDDEDGDGDDDDDDDDDNDDDDDSEWKSKKKCWVKTSRAAQIKTIIMFKWANGDSMYLQWRFTCKFCKSFLG